MVSENAKHTLRWIVTIIHGLIAFAVLLVIFGVIGQLLRPAFFAGEEPIPKYIIGGFTLTVPLWLTIRHVIRTRPKK